MKFTILGMGKTGHSTACYLLNKGQNVCVWDRNPEKLKIIKEKGIVITGALEGHFNPDVEGDISTAVKDADYICINTLASGHKDVATLLKKNLSSGQTIIVFNSNWGLYEFSDILGDELKEKGVTLCETGGMHLMTDLPEIGRCHLRKIKSRLSISVLPRQNGSDVVEKLKDVFPQFFLKDTAISTSMDCSNYILHAPITIFMASRIERGEDNLFYKEGASPLVVKYIEEIDRERLNVMKAIGVEGTSCFDIITSAWGTKADNLYDAIHINYPTSKGPKSLEYRFVTEDIPFGLVPVSKLGKLYGIETPYVDTLVDIYCKLTGKDFVSNGPEFTIDKINALVNA